ncbi:putative NADPH dehydrogenase [delta proteobacterium NaphS2]|nr:putative NADPH dehydrogenase [delta proteobacterium NaphS2]
MKMNTQGMKYEMLFAPISINGLELKNRVVMSPTHDGFANKDGDVTPKLIDFYLRRAKGGLGMVIVGAVAINPRSFPPLVRLSDDQHIRGMSEFTAKIHAESDSKICAQLIDWLKFGKHWKQTINDLTSEEIIDKMDYFVKGAARAQQAGFDAVEIHGAHGYTIASFLSLNNKRTDGYGKTFEGRMKFVREVYDRVRNVVGPDYPVGIRINGDDFIIDGNTLKQTRLIAKALAEMGLDYISVSAGGRYEDARGVIPKVECPHPYPPIGGYSGYRCMPPSWMPEAVNVYLAADLRNTIRQAGFQTPVITAGRIPIPKVAEAVLKEGQADLIGLSRPLLRDPEWALKAEEERDKDIKKCTYCNDCVEREIHGEPSYCQYNKEQ